MSETPTKTHDPQRASAGLVAMLAIGAFCVLTVPLASVLAVLYVPETRATRIKNNEALALKTLRKINKVQLRVINEDLDRDNKRNFHEIEYLARYGHLDRDLRQGQKNGYRYEILVIRVKNSNGHYWLKASPLLQGESGNRSFLTNEAGEFYFSPSDQPLPKTAKPSSLPGWIALGR